VGVFESCDFVCFFVVGEFGYVCACYYCAFVGFDFGFQFLNQGVYAAFKVAEGSA